MNLDDPQHDPCEGLIFSEDNCFFLKIPFLDVEYLLRKRRSLGINMNWLSIFDRTPDGHLSACLDELLNRNMRQY